MIDNQPALTAKDFDALLHPSTTLSSIKARANGHR